MDFYILDYGKRHEMEKFDLNSFTKEQAAAYQEELQDVELTPEALEKVAGGWEKNAESKLLQTIIKKY